MKAVKLEREAVIEALEMVRIVANNSFHWRERIGQHRGEFILTYQGKSVILRGNITDKWLEHCLKLVGVK